MPAKKKEVIKKPAALKVAVKIAESKAKAPAKKKK
jgi:hypothetical protein